MGFPAMIAHAANAPCPVLAEVDELTRLIVADASAHLPAWLDRCRGVLDRFRRCLGETDLLRERMTAEPPNSRCCIPPAESGNWRVRLVEECDAVAALLASCGDGNRRLAREIVLRIENVVALFRYHFARPVPICPYAAVAPLPARGSGT